MNDLVTQMQTYVAHTSVGASTVRGQKAPGLVAKLRELLAEVDLKKFGKTNDAKFGELLDIETAAIQRRMPPGTRHWGIARKVLNIFLRDSFYNFYLRQFFSLEPLEGVLEIPLDSLTVTGIKARSPKRSLPRWKGVKHLTKEASELIQKRAQEIASERGTSRVHLDIYFWLERD